MARLGVIAAGVLFLIGVAAGVATAAEPVIQDCLEGAGDDLKSVTIEDLRFPPSPPLTS